MGISYKEYSMSTGTINESYNLSIYTSLKIEKPPSPLQLLDSMVQECSYDTPPPPPKKKE